MSKNKELKKISPYSISLYLLLAVVFTAIWIILFQFTKEVFEENTTLWGILPWSDSYFMFALLFMILPMVFLMVLYLLIKKKRK